MQLSHSISLPRGLLFLSLLFLAGCGEYAHTQGGASAPDISAVTRMGAGTATYKDYLAAEYFNLSRYEQARGDYAAARRYVSRGERVLAGQMVNPVRPGLYDLTKAQEDELRSARATLLAAFRQYAVPQNRAALALAQTRFDCWADQAEEGKENPVCKKQFEDAMASLVLPPPVPQAEPVSSDDIILAE
jgi:OOP family OmpA-OmpF porin